MRSRSAVVLAKTGASQEEIGQVAGTSRVAASHWLNGTTKPNAERRERIAKRWPGVTAAGWDEPWVGEQRSVEERSTIPLGTAGLRRGIEEQAGELFRTVKDRKDLTHTERAKLLRELTNITLALSKMPAGSLVDHPDWPELEAAVARVLKGHPVVAQAFEDEMARLEAGRVSS